MKFSSPGMAAENRTKERGRNLENHNYQSGFQLSVQSTCNLVIALVLLYCALRWLTKLAPLFQPMRSKTNHTFSCIWHRLHAFASNSDWFNVLFTCVVIVGVITLVLVLRHSNENRPSMGTLHTRAVTKIASCRVNTTSRRGIKQLGISFGSIFLLFSYESSRGPRS